MSGYVYLIGNDRFQWYKIGKSKDAQVRVEHLGILLPFKLKIFGIWKAQNHTLMESALHEQHTTSRINGEWFTFSKKQVEELHLSIPTVACVFWHTDPNSTSEFSTFSNMERDILSPKSKCVKMDIPQLAPRR